jgi:hypothetical protein
MDSTQDTGIYTSSGMWYPSSSLNKISLYLYAWLQGADGCYALEWMQKHTEGVPLLI